MLNAKQKAVAARIWQEIRRANRILLHCHPSPDPDCIGGALAMMWTLKKIGKQVTMIAGDSEKPPAMAHLPGFDTIEQKNYLEINPEEFGLFLILDSSDQTQISKKGTVKFPQSMITVVIDHHASNQKFGQLNLVDDRYPAVCQIIYELLAREWRPDIPPEAAVCLFVGIYDDTGGFQYDRTGPETFNAASALAKINPDFSQAIFQLENNFEPEHIIFKGLALSSIEHYFHDQVAISVVSYTQLQRHGIKKRHTEKTGISNMLKSVTGWEIGISLTETKPDVASLSFRTRGKYDVSKIAIATGSGGGHPSAAGATLNLPLDQAKKFLLETIAKVYPQLSEP